MLLSRSQRGGQEGRLLDNRSWVILFIAAPFLTINAIFVFGEVQAIVRGNYAIDWRVYAEASHRFFDGFLFADEPLYSYRYSPVLAPFLRAVEWVGQDGWRLLHVVAVFALPTWPVRLAVLASWPFWFDVNAGGIAVFALVLAWYAIGGKRWAIVSYLVAVLLVPKPLFLPVAGWLLWKQPAFRAPFVVAFAANAGLVLATGWGPEWVRRLALATDDITNESNFGPSRLFGIVTMAVQLPLAVWFTWRSRLGLASLAASPYWLPYYFIVLALEAAPRTLALQRQEREVVGQPG